MKAKNSTSSDQPGETIALLDGRHLIDNIFNHHGFFLETFENGFGYGKVSGTKTWEIGVGMPAKRKKNRQAVHMS